MQHIYNHQIFQKNCIVNFSNFTVESLITNRGWAEAQTYKQTNKQIYIHTYIHTCKHTYIRVGAYTSTLTHLHNQSVNQTHTYIHTYIHTLQLIYRHLQGAERRKYFWYSPCGEIIMIQSTKQKNLILQVNNYTCTLLCTVYIQYVDVHQVNRT